MLFTLILLNLNMKQSQTVNMKARKNPSHLTASDVNFPQDSLVKSGYKPPPIPIMFPRAQQLARLSVILPTPSHSLPVYS
ncbi:hypothetical protein CEXT_134611 [Caerostris extrusa]|uniref:Uncharacterized protein n=1 Tax=Caerostris extrusa TaxID=172846 RepID=A0AAV4X1R6_CAEEX|nr:hypothetical protein CEXT_134611 [Caerostris extrusa]